MVITKRTSNLPLICLICGDVARGINFDVMTCMSCKAFFRRHVLRSKNSLQCLLNNDCKITQLTRSGCSACRLKKCFSLGMNPNLIRYATQKHRQIVKKKDLLLPLPQPLNLLQKDISTLTTMEWNLLSNILHVYDAGNAIQHTKSMLQHQSSLPPKLRSKSAVTLDINKFYYTTFPSFMDRIAYFHELSIDSRRAIIERNTGTAGTCNSIFIAREANVLENTAYAEGCLSLYGRKNYDEFIAFQGDIPSNGILFKVMLIIIGFSTNCSVLVPYNIENMTTIPCTTALIYIQNILVTMFWKYLNYQYGFLGAVKCFNSLIKFVLNIIRWTEEGYTAQQDGILETLVEKVDRSLVI